MPKDVDIKEFATRVERVCDFFIDQAREEGIMDGSNDITVLQKLKEDAADLQFSTPIENFIEGLSDYMHGTKKE